MGRRIRLARKKTGLSQDEIAYRAGISMQYLSDVERGQRNISAKNLMRLAKVLNTEVGEFFPPIKYLPKFEQKLY